MDILLYLTKFTTMSAAVIVATSFLTKPNEQSFNEYFDSYLKITMAQKSKNPIISILASKGISAISANHVQDFVLVKVGFVAVGDLKLSFIGAFGNWYPI